MKGFAILIAVGIGVALIFAAIDFVIKEGKDSATTYADENGSNGKRDYGDLRGVIRVVPQKVVERHPDIANAR